MPHISRKRLKKQVAKELADEFITFLATSKSKQDTRVIAKELLSQTERVMLAKRLAVVLLLVRGYSFNQIEELLGVTRQTVVRLSRGPKEGRYEKVMQYARPHTRGSKHEKFLDAFVRVIHMGMPPRNDPKRWQKFRKSLYS